MPTRVRVPPNIAAYDKGNNNLPALISLFFFTLLISVATTAVLLIKAEAKAVPIKSRNIDFTLEPLKTLLLRRRKILVRSNENEQSTNKINVTKPGFTALARILSTLTKESAKQTSTVIENIRSGTC